jgi:hypothetical protein
MSFIFGELAAMLTYPWHALDLRRRFPLKARAVNADFTRIRQLNRRDEGYSKAMSTRTQIFAIERAAGHAGSAATLILGSLLLLIRP